MKQPETDATSPALPAEEETYASSLARFFLRENLNFLITNRLPRRFVTKLMGRFTRIRNRWLTQFSLAAWKLFADDLRLDEAVTTDFASLHECFIRKLRPGVRPIDPDPNSIVSPCDAVVGAAGSIRGTELIQAKGFPYTLMDLLGDEALVERHRDGQFITLRLKANMYHRFHTPADCRVSEVTYISGDTWNVNPIALKRIEKLFCKNERAIIDVQPTFPGTAITMVPIASILVSGIRLNILDTPLTLAHEGRRSFKCDASLRKGDELGRFESGSTIVLFASGNFSFCDTIVEGATVRVGVPLLRYMP